MKAWLPRLILYLLFFSVATGIFLVAGFPSERLDLLVNARLARASGGALRVEGSGYHFPLSLTAGRLLLATGGKSIDLGRLTATPALLSLPGALLGKSFAASLVLEGEWGRLPIGLLAEKAGPWKAEVAGGAVDLARHPALASLPLALAGEGAVRMSLAGVRGTTEGLSGQGELLLTRTKVEGSLLERFGVPPLEFSRIALPWSLDRGVLTLTEGKVEGDLAGTASGTSRLAPQRFSLSSLDFTLSLRPGKAAPGAASGKLGPMFALLGAGAGEAGVLALRITGTVGQPAFALNPGR